MIVLGVPSNQFGSQEPENEKIIKDTPSDSNLASDAACSSIACRRKNYASRRLVNKFGSRNMNTGLDYKHFLQMKGKLYTQNAFALLPENKVPGKQNEFKSCPKT